MTLRVGQVGFGRWGVNLARNIAKHASVAWVCEHDVDALKRAEAAGYYAISDPAWEDVEAVVIATPIATHAGLVRDALFADKHVLCEKPLAVTKHFAESVKRLSSSPLGKSVVMMSAPWLYHPAIQRAGEVASELGAPLWFRAARTSWDERDLDPIADLLPHDVGILKAWTGQRVTELIALREGPTAAIAMRTESGLVATMMYTYRERSKQRSVECGFEKGALYTFGENAYTLERNDGGSSVVSMSGPEPLDAMCAEFVACCRTGRTPRFGNVDDALHVAEVIEAAHKSVSERRVVTL